MTEYQHGYEITDDWKFWPPCKTCGGMCPKNEINCPGCQKELNDDD